MIDEQLRLDELQRYDVLDTEREAVFDRLADLAAIVCGAPMALVTFVDEKRQWFKASHGVELDETPREISFCDFAVREGKLLVVEDTTRDPRFQANPFVTGPERIRFYAGAPLVTPRAMTLGTLCVLDRQPRLLEPERRQALELLRDEVMLVLEHRRELLELRRSEGLRQEAVEALLATKIDLEARIELRTREVESARSRMQAILARIADGFVALDRQWRYTYVNERAAQIFNRAPAQLIGKHAWSEFPEQMRQRLQLACERAMREQTPLTVTDHSAPSDRWFENRIYPSLEGVTLFFTEITERRRAEEALKDTARRLAEAQAVAHVGSWEWSVAENRVRWSEEMHRIYGVSKEQFEGSYEGFLAHVHPDDLEHTKAVIGDAYQHPKRFTYDHRVVRTDGAVRMLHTVGDVVVDDSGRPLRMVGSCWDTTEQWQATRKLQSTAAAVQALVDTMVDAVLVVDEDGCVQAANGRFATMFDIPNALSRRGTPATASLEHVAARFPSDPTLLEALRTGGSVTDGRSFSTTLHAASGVVELTSRPLIDDGRTAGRVWIFRLTS